MGEISIGQSNAMVQRMPGDGTARKQDQSSAGRQRLKNPDLAGKGTIWIRNEMYWSWK